MSPIESDVWQIARAALRAVDAGARVRQWLEQNPVEVQFLAGAGKACAPMVRAAMEVLGDKGLEGKFEGGIVAIPRGYDDRVPACIERHLTSHPLPDESSLEAGRALFARVQEAGPSARWLGLWSGGGSACLELPLPGVTLEELRQVTARSMHAGEDIVALHARRRELSALKGGGLARAGGRWQNLVLSDVVGDDPMIVGGGPAVLPGDGTVVVGTLGRALEAARAEAFALRYVPMVLESELSGEAAEAGMRLARALKASLGGPPMALFLAGEPTVRGVPEGAVGGRMQELALSAALAIDGLPVTVLALATDGRDGTSLAAGARVDGQTAGLLRAAGLEGATLLAQHESHRALAAVDAVFSLDPGQSNVRDLVVALIRP